MESMQNQVKTRTIYDILKDFKAPSQSIPVQVFDLTLNGYPYTFVRLEGLEESSYLSSLRTPITSHAVGSSIPIDEPREKIHILIKCPDQFAPNQPHPSTTLPPATQQQQYLAKVNQELDLAFLDIIFLLLGYSTTKDLNILNEDQLVCLLSVCEQLNLKLDIIVFLAALADNSSSSLDSVTKAINACNKHYQYIRAREPVSVGSLRVEDLIEYMFYEYLLKVGLNTDTVYGLVERIVTSWAPDAKVGDKNLYNWKQIQLYLLGEAITRVSSGTIYEPGTETVNKGTFIVDPIVSGVTFGLLSRDLLEAVTESDIDFTLITQDLLENAHPTSQIRNTSGTVPNTLSLPGKEAASTQAISNSVFLGLNAPPRSTQPISQDPRQLYPLDYFTEPLVSVVIPDAVLAGVTGSTRPVSATQIPPNPEGIIPPGSVPTESMIPSIHEPSPSPILLSGDQHLITVGGRTRENIQDYLDAIEQVQEGHLIESINACISAYVIQSSPNQVPIMVITQKERGYSIDNFLVSYSTSERKLIKSNPNTGLVEYLPIGSLFPSTWYEIRVHLANCPG